MTLPSVGVSVGVAAGVAPAAEAWAAGACGAVAALDVGGALVIDRPFALIRVKGGWPLRRAIPEGPLGSDRRSWIRRPGRASEGPGQATLRGPLRRHRRPQARRATSEASAPPRRSPR